MTKGDQAVWFNWGLSLGVIAPAGVMIVSLVAEGETPIGIVGSYPQLVVDDVRAALEYAAATVRERGLPLRTGVRVS